MNEQTGGHFIAKALYQAGARQAFGIPGGEVLALLDGFLKEDIKFNLVKHENSAGFMAEGLWHADGSLPILVTTIGPGLANGINTIANAHQERVPLIVLTGCVDEVEVHSYTHQIFDHQALMRPIVKGSFRLVKGAMARIMDKALHLAQSGQPGPVHLDLPISLASALCDELPIMAQPTSLQGTLASDETLSDLRKVLAHAKRPLVIAGVDAVNEGAGGAIAQFCTVHHIPLITSYKGKGLLDENHPLALGAAGLSPKADQRLLPLVMDADCVILAGYDPIEMRTGWRDPWNDDATVIDITPVHRDHGMHSVTASLVGSISDTLLSLEKDLNRSPGTWIETSVAQTRAALLEDFSAGPSGFGPEHVFATLRATLPANTVVTADSGAHRILVSQMWQCQNPRSFLQSSCLCTMGCAVPLAAGYQLGAGEGTPVCAFVGDAGMEMGLGELATLRDMKVPVIICVLVDECLSLIEIKQRGSNYQNLGVDFGGSDFPTIAKGLGGHGVWIDNVADLKEEAQAALQRRDQFTLLACRIGRHSYDGKF